MVFSAYCQCNSAEEEKAAAISEYCDCVRGHIVALSQDLGMLQTPRGLKYNPTVKAVMRIYDGEMGTYSGPNVCKECDQYEFPKKILPLVDSQVVKKMLRENSPGRNRRTKFCYYKVSLMYPNYATTNPVASFPEVKLLHDKYLSEKQKYYSEKFLPWIQEQRKNGKLK